MSKSDRREPQICQLRVVLRGIGPLIWRRRLAPEPFEIRGREHGVYRDGGPLFHTDARKLHICDLNLRRLERYRYKYDFGDSWIHDLRVEATLPADLRKTYPACDAGKCAAPPEDCGGPHSFIANRQHYARCRGGH